MGVRHKVEATGDFMMEPGSPLEAVPAATLVVRVRRDIDDCSDGERDLLLSDFLCAAWPSRRAQAQ
jgi:hypothetical protein